MRLFRLEPKQKENHNWQASTYCGQVIVRAMSENRARELAGLAFLQAISYTRPGQEVALPPWQLAECTDCREERSEKYSSEGEEGILAPDPDEWE